ncbi:translation elongation factor Ts [Alicyclobacillus sp. SO9]|uniref:translation elongation factor Ts n=1 Tax=Alicyclobacillus sp. SO9 TaxID=2665646 RepID=UPI0018E6DCEA|nr:translation elongation factor Ts [Alicyclobacillus sp. SO9]QQE80829.1 translation elongation factor Ts [Alicyclobacillus sp. SO9]
MQVTAQMVKDLRTQTGAGMMDCKNALKDADGDMEKALKVLREKGLASASKKSGRVASEGIVEAYIHGGGRIGVLLEVNCETDFVAKNDDFKNFVRDIAMHVAAANPTYVRREDVPEDVLTQEREIVRQQTLNEGKPEKIVDKIVEGRIDKYLSEICLLEQAFVKNPDKTVDQLVKEEIAHIGENISVRRFARYVVGEGIEKEEKDFAEEVMEQVGK